MYVLAGVAPLLCAGITTYSPIRRWRNIKGKKVGVVGLGGLGHMGVKFAKAFGANVAVFTTSPGKKEDAYKRKDDGRYDDPKLICKTDCGDDGINGEHDIKEYDLGNDH